MLKIKIFFFLFFCPFYLIAISQPQLATSQTQNTQPSIEQASIIITESSKDPDNQSPTITPSKSSTKSTEKSVKTKNPLIKKVKTKTKSIAVSKALPSIQKKATKSLTSLTSLTPNFHDFDRYQKLFSKETLEKKLYRYLQKHPQIEDHYRLTRTAFCLYKSLEDKKKNRPEYRLRLNLQSPAQQTPSPSINTPSVSSTPACSSTSPSAALSNLSSSSLPLYSSSSHSDLSVYKKDCKGAGSFAESSRAELSKKEALPPSTSAKELSLLGTTLLNTEKANLSLEQGLLLKGKKIAIDPGHFGGIWASLEQRKFRYESIYFDEGTLTFLTAKKLKVLLEKLGAFVFLTRSSIGQGAYPLTFYEWKEQNPSNLPDKMYFHQVYNRLDLLTRAEKINNFQPDLTLILHFNAHLESSEPSTMLTNYNYHLAFVSGSFSKKELADAISRYEFLRLLLTDDLEKSIRFSSLVLKNLEKTTNITSFQEGSLLQEKDVPIYLKSTCIKIDKGLYSRNLALTRLVHSPLCYGEVFCQNNLSEARKLNLKNTLYSSRLDSVAQAYCDAIVQFFIEEKK